MHVRVTVTLFILALNGCGGGTGGGGTSSSYTIGGSVSGLSAANSVTLQDATGDSVALSSNGSFTMPQTIAQGASYSVTVSTQPTDPPETCTVSNGTGVVGSANVTNIDVSCGTGITASNADSVVRAGNSTGEILLQVASFVGERLRYLSGHLGATASETCSDPYNAFIAGTASYTFQDTDNSGSLTPGDMVTIVLSKCLSQSLADTASGTLTLVIAAPSHASAGGGAFAATTALDGLTLTALNFSGSADIEYDFAETEYGVHASVGATGLQYKFLSGGFFQPDTISVSNATASKTIDYTQPRYAVQLASTFTGQTLGGPFTLTTPEVLAGRLNAFPDAGKEVFASAASNLTCSAQTTDSNQGMDVTLGAGGSTIPGMFWEEGVNGFLWWEPRGFSNIQFNSRPSYTTVQHGPWQLQLLFTEPQQTDPINQILSAGVDVDTPIRLFFNAPVDASSAVLQFEPAQSQTPIPAVTAVDGPIVTVTAQTQLQHGQTYQLLSPDYITSPYGGGPRAVSMNLTTLNNLQAAGAPSPGVALPGQTVQLKSSGSTANNGPIAHYLWTQTDGPTVSLTGAATDTASFVVPAGVQPGVALRFTLTITDLNGATDSVPVTVFAITDPTQPFLYYRMQQISTVGQEPETATFESPPNGPVRTEFDVSGVPVLFRFIYNEGGATGYDQLQFMPGSGTIAPGSYSSATTPGGDPFFISSYNCYSATVWQLTIYEAQGAPDGTAAQFSVDFTMSCPAGNLAPISGSLRVNSTVPLP